MKAILLAAGLGTRLRPLTDTIPKCLVPVCGRPLLSRWLELLERHSVSEVLINLHHLAEQTFDFLGCYNGALKVCSVYEPVLLGSAGTLLHNVSFMDPDKPTLICNADNLTNVDLGDLLDSHHFSGKALTMGLFRTPYPSDCGIADLDSEGTVISFIEKPATPRSNLANAGIYVMNRKVIQDLPTNYPLDIGKHLIPTLIGSIHGHLVKGYLRDIGTWESYNLAQEEWHRLDNQPDTVQS